MSHQNKIDSWKQGGWHPSIEVYKLAYHKRHSTLHGGPPNPPHDAGVSYPQPSSTRRLVRERVDLLLELAVDGGDGGAADAGAVEVLEGDCRGVQPSKL